MPIVTLSVRCVWPCHVFVVAVVVYAAVVDVSCLGPPVVVRHRITYVVDVVPPSQIDSSLLCRCSSKETTLSIEKLLPRGSY